MARQATLSNTRQVIEILEEDGAVILKAFSSAEDVRQVNADAAPYLKASVDSRLSHSLPYGTARCERLFGVSSTARETWLQQPALISTLEHFLRTETTPYNSHDIITSGHILSASTTLDIGPGQECQTLHRDDFIWHQTHTAQTKYSVGSDTGMALLVAGVNTTAANGATRFMPGSHLWEDGRQMKVDDEVVVELEAGDALLFLGSTVHGAGGNTTTTSRIMHGFFFCRSYIRPEENQHLWWTREEVQKWSLAAQKQAGYVLDGPFLGHCNESNPIDHFRANAAIGVRDT